MESIASLEPPRAEAEGRRSTRVKDEPSTKDRGVLFVTPEAVGMHLKTDKREAPHIHTHTHTRQCTMNEWRVRQRSAIYVRSLHWTDGGTGDTHTRTLFNLTQMLLHIAC